ncbi:MAG: insulinase family protein, partial [Acidobacteriota bacterium]
YTMKNKKLFHKFAFIAVMFAATPAFSQSLPAPRQEKLLNGLKVLMWSDAKASNVSVKIRIHAGSAFDPQGREGVMQMLADNIFPTEATRDFFKEDLAGGLEIVTTYDYIQINASSKPESFLTMLETLSAAVSNPAIDAETTARLRTALLTKVTALESDTSYVADQAVAKRLFGTFPYGRPQLGTSESLKKIIFPDLIDAKSRFLSADNATITISGNFDSNLGYRAVRRLFGSWLKSDKRVPSTFRRPDDPPTALQTIASPNPDAAAIRYAVRGSARGDKDFARSLVFTAIIESRLKARAGSGDASNVFVQNEQYVLPGEITIGFNVPGKTPLNSNGKLEATDVIMKILSDPITDAEFQAARSAKAAAWAGRSRELFWLDADTFKTADVNSDYNAFDSVTLADVATYAEKVRKTPYALVLVNTPSTK